LLLLLLLLLLLMWNFVAIYRQQILKDSSKQHFTH